MLTSIIKALDRLFASPYMPSENWRLERIRRTLDRALSKHIKTPPAPQTARGPGRRRLIVHAGLHKTGTTALQLFLESAADELREHGILYPRSGRIFAAHHNIAWQVTRDRQFVPPVGTIDDLAAEAAQFGGDVIVSSEELERVIEEPDRFLPLTGHPVFRDYELTLVVYVRSQTSYLESLYMEVLADGVTMEELSSLAQKVLRDRQLNMGDWAFRFDYARIYEKWSSCGMANLIVRNYHQMSGGSTISDFCSIVCPGLNGVTQGSALRKNRRPVLHNSLLRFYKNRVGRPLRPGEKKAIERISNMLQGRTVTLSNELRLALNEAFATENRALCAAARMPEAGLTSTEPAPGGAVALEKVFSVEVLNMIAANPSSIDVDAFLEGL